MGLVLISAFLSALYLATGLGLYRREAWSRSAGIICGLLLLPAFPIGTLVGGFGMIALARSKRLFSGESFVIAEMAKELSQRRKRLNH